MFTLEYQTDLFVLKLKKGGHLNLQKVMVPTDLEEDSRAASKTEKQF